MPVLDAASDAFVRVGITKQSGHLDRRKQDTVTIQLAADSRTSQLPAVYIVGSYCTDKQFINVSHLGL